MSEKEHLMLEVAAGIHYTFNTFQDEIWPGYDLSTQPFILYLPNECALLINSHKPVEGFGPLPAEWPDPGIPVYYHQGQYRDMIGQFRFNFRIDTVNSFAMGLPQKIIFSNPNPGLTLFTTTVHEGFHQYQFNHFGDIPWAREEQYPILDAQNTALASLEMFILKDALIAAYKSNNDQRDICLKRFIAVRSYRWNHSGGFVSRYEQGQEINEGTARYVEMKSLERFLSIKKDSITNAFVRDLRTNSDSATFPGYLVHDMDARLTGIAVAPDDMLRNRIYPVGATLGFLLDNLGINWKIKFQEAGDSVSFLQFLQKYYRPEPQDMKKYFLAAQREYHYSEIESHSGALIHNYILTYDSLVNLFYQSPGFRIKVTFPSNGLKRFRSSKEKHYVMENGKTLFCAQYALYKLEIDSTHLEIHDAAVLEKNNPQNRTREVTFYSGDIHSIVANQQEIPLSGSFSGSFDSLGIKGDLFNLLYKIEGRVEISGKTIKITPQ